MDKMLFNDKQGGGKLMLNKGTAHTSSVRKHNGRNVNYVYYIKYDPVSLRVHQSVLIRSVGQCVVCVCVRDVKINTYQLKQRPHSLAGNLA